MKTFRVIIGCVGLVIAGVALGAIVASESMPQWVLSPVLIALALNVIVNIMPALFGEDM